MTLALDPHNLTGCRSVFGNVLAGERATVEVVGKYFALSTPLEDLLGSNGKSLGDKIERHMDQNPGDWSVEFMFNQIGALD